MAVKKAPPKLTRSGAPGYLSRPVLKRSNEEDEGILAAILGEAASTGLDQVGAEEEEAESPGAAEANNKLSSAEAQTVMKTATTRLANALWANHQKQHRLRKPDQVDEETISRAIEAELQEASAAARLLAAPSSSASTVKGSDTRDTGKSLRETQVTDEQQAQSQTK